MDDQVKVSRPQTDLKWAVGLGFYDGKCHNLSIPTPQRYITDRFKHGARALQILKPKYQNISPGNRKRSISNHTEPGESQERNKEFSLACGAPPLPWNSLIWPRDQLNGSRDLGPRSRDHEVWRSWARFQVPCSLTACSELLTLSRKKLFTTPPIVLSEGNASISLVVYSANWTLIGRLVR